MDEKDSKQIEEIIRKNKEGLKDASVRRYVQCLVSLWEVAFSKMTKEFHPKLFFADHKRIMEALDGIKITTRKTMLCALMAISHGEKDEVVKIYRERMIHDSEVYNQKEQNHEMSESQKENWIDWDEIKKSYEVLGKRIAWAWKAEPSKDNLLVLQKYVILSCYVLIPPRRSVDYTDIKWKDYDEKTDNCYDSKGKQFIFNAYKTARHYGTQKISLPKGLDSIMSKWVKLLKKADNIGPYCFFTEGGNKLTSAHMSKLLASVFGKRVGVNIIRHSFVTCNLGSKLKELEQIATDMGHSTEEQKLYRKDTA